MTQIPNEVREQLNFQASLLWLGVHLEASVSPAAVDEKVAVEVEKLVARL